MSTDEPSADEATGLLLAGGQSRRFGRDKARHAIDGQSMIRRVYQTLATVVPRVLVSVRDDEGHYDDLLPASPPYVRDVVPDAGPLAGLAAGARSADVPWLLVLACDLPAVTPSVLHTLLNARTSGLDAVVARTPDEQAHPHCAAYRRAPVRPLVESMLEADRRSMHGLLAELDVRYVDAPKPPLRNVNRPEDLC